MTLALLGMPYLGILMHACFWPANRRQRANGQPLLVRSPPQSMLCRVGWWISSQNAGFYLNIYRTSIMLCEGLGILCLPTVAYSVASNLVLDLVQRALYGLCEPYDLRTVICFSLFADLPALYLYYSRMQVPYVLLSVAGQFLSFISMQAAMSFFFSPRIALSPAVANDRRVKVE